MFNIFKNKNKEKATDSICGMSVDKNKAQFSYVNNGETSYFCSENCKRMFAEDKKQGQKKKGGCC